MSPVKKHSVGGEVAIIGAGKLGEALASVLLKKFVTVELWDVVPGKVPNQKPLEEIVPRADFVLFSTPSWCLRAAVSEVLQHAGKRAIIISFSKGIEPDTNLFSSEILEELLQGRRWGVVSGPMLSDELKTGARGRAVVASANPLVRKKLVELFSATTLLLEGSSDVAGVATVGVLKNIYAVSLGIADGIGWGENMKGWLVSKAVSEMKEIIIIVGGKRETVDGAAGLGDFIATGFSKLSRNRSAGHELGSSGTTGTVCEGIVSIAQLLTRLGQSRCRFPLLLAVEAVCQEGSSAKEIFARYAAKT